MEIQADKMKERSAARFDCVLVDTNVIVPIPDVDKSRLDPLNITAIVLEIRDQIQYELACKHGVLQGWFARNMFQPTAQNILTRADCDLAAPMLSIRSAAGKASLTSGQRMYTTASF